jgi:hypothetical protein
MGLDFTGWYTVVVGFEDTGNTVVRFRLDYRPVSRRQRQLRRAGYICRSEI